MVTATSPRFQEGQMDRQVDRQVDRLNRYTNATLVRWKRLAAEAVPSASVRLKQLIDRPPSGVPRLLDFGWSGATPGKPLLRLETEWVPGASLFQVRNLLRSRDLRKIATQLRRQAAIWQAEGFVHGDLSPSNILVQRHNGENAVLRFVDWVVDLNGFEATPRYAAPEVFAGRRSFASDRYAIREILKSCHLA